MANTVPSSAISEVRQAKNAHNESERRTSNIEKSLLDFDNSVEAKVRKAQKQGASLLNFDPNAATSVKSAFTARA